MSDRNTTTISGGGAVPSSFSSGRSYALSGKIMLSSIVVLFAVVILMLCLHIYARWYLLRRNRLRRGNGRLLFFTSQNGLDLPHRGLDRAVLGSIPVFVYSDKSKAADGDEDSCGRVECAVCLCEFQEGERCRTLPNCKHGFHVECIDMWFDSHSTCPLCRSAVEPPPPPESIQVLSETTPGSSEQCESCRRDEGSTTLAASTNTATGGSSSSVPASSFGIRVELPVRRVDEEFKSPGGRMAAIKRILSMDLRGYRGGGSSSSGEVDVEKGEAAEERGAPPTPRPPR